MRAIVFSKDRALQLDAFLRSYTTCVNPAGPVHVLYTTSSDRHAASYQEVFAAHPVAVPHLQGDFKADVISLMPDHGLVSFFVDDLIFLRRWDVPDWLPPWTIMSLRLGPHLTENYASGGVAQDVPPLKLSHDGVWRWSWRHGELAWRYPLSLDGHVFEASDIAPFIRQAPFTSPNTLESELEKVSYVFLDFYGLCYDQSKVVNLPWNIVQTDWANRHAAYKVEDFLRLWETCYQLDLTRYADIVPVSVHEDLPLHLQKRQVLVA